MMGPPTDVLLEVPGGRPLQCAQQSKAWILYTVHAGYFCQKKSVTNEIFGLFLVHKRIVFRIEYI